MDAYTDSNILGDNVMCFKGDQDSSDKTLTLFFCLQRALSRQAGNVTYNFHPEQCLASLSWIVDF